MAKRLSRCPLSGGTKTLCYMGKPIGPEIGELRAPMLGVECDRIAKRPAIAIKFCTVIALGTINMFARRQLNRPQNRGVSGRKVWVQWKGIGKLQVIAIMFGAVTKLLPRNMFARFQLSTPQIG